MLSAALALVVFSLGMAFADGINRDCERKCNAKIEQIEKLQQIKPSPETEKPKVESETQTQQ